MANADVMEQDLVDWVALAIARQRWPLSTMGGIVAHAGELDVQRESRAVIAAVREYDARTEPPRRRYVPRRRPARLTHNNNESGEK